MSKRMLMALISMVGIFVSLYLTLYKVGRIGSLACGTGGCETVQSSKWGDFLGLPVAAWGTGFYLLVLGLSLAGLRERYAESRWLVLALVVVTAWGVLFTAWLTYLELFIIEAICRWCVGSALMVLLLFGLALWDWRSGDWRLAADS